MLCLSKLLGNEQFITQQRTNVTVGKMDVNLFLAGVCGKPTFIKAIKHGSEASSKMRGDKWLRADFRTQAKRSERFAYHQFVAPFRPIRYIAACNLPVAMENRSETLQVADAEKIVM